MAKAPATTAVPGAYIVTPKSGATVPAGVTATHRYRTVLNGFSAKLNGAQLDRLRADSRVAAIEQAVANMSLGGGFSTAVNNSANALADSGVFLAVAAGNSSANACNSSPSSAANATVAAAGSRTDARASRTVHPTSTIWGKDFVGEPAGGARKILPPNC